MPDDPDAERIQGERDQRRAAERQRMEEVRRARQLELARLRELEFTDSARWERGGAGRVPRVVIDPGRVEPVLLRPSEGAEGAAARTEPPSTPRAIGASIPPAPIEEFLRTDPTERFDIMALNVLRYPPLIEAARQDPALLATVARRAEALMLRVKQEVDDPLTAGAFLRDQVLRWYRESPTDPTWAERTPEKWAGLFSDSRVSGGRLQPWINVRLWSLREAAFRGGRFREKVRRGFLRDHAGETATERTAAQQIHGEVAQAFLDDLATNRRSPSVPLPLVRLSELAVRRQVPTVNEALALLFNAPETGPFVVLHPNRYPDCDELQIRPPTGTASGAAMAYTLVPGRTVRKGAPASTHPRDAADEDSGPAGEDAEPSDADLDATTVWEAGSVSAATWQRLVEMHRRERRRMDSPPKDYRSRPAYASLVQRLVEDGDFRKAFLSVKWRGRPAGLPLLVSLLQKGTLAPEVATDHEYLEAELGELVQGDTQWRPPDGVWTLRDWKVTREGSHREGFRYRAQPSA